MHPSPIIFLSSPSEVFVYPPFSLHIRLCVSTTQKPKWMTDYSNTEQRPSVYFWPQRPPTVAFVSYVFVHSPFLFQACLIFHEFVLSPPLSHEHHREPILFASSSCQSFLPGPTTRGAREIGGSVGLSPTTQASDRLHPVEFFQLSTVTLKRTRWPEQALFLNTATGYLK